MNALVPFNVSNSQGATIQVEFNGVKGNSVTVPVVGASRESYPGLWAGPGMDSQLSEWSVRTDQFQFDPRGPEQLH